MSGNNIKPQEKFVPHIDTQILGVNIDMEKAVAEKILGKPKRVESTYEGAFDGDVHYYYYDFGHIRLEPFEDEHLISSIRIEKPGFKGPRGIEIGDSLESVLSKFPSEKSPVQEHGKRYLYGIPYETSGVITYDQAGKAEAIDFIYLDEDGGNFYLHLDIKNNKVSIIMLGAVNI